MVLGVRQKVREVPGPNLKGVFPTVYPFATASLKRKQYDKTTLSPCSQAREHRRRLLTWLLLSQDAAADDATGCYRGVMGVTPQVFQHIHLERQHSAPHQAGGRERNNAAGGYRSLQALLLSVPLLSRLCAKRQILRPQRFSLWGWGN